MSFLDYLYSRATKLAEIYAEPMDTKFVARAMDQLLVGPAYGKEDKLETKLEKLEVRAGAYLAYDGFLRKYGQPGNPEIDAAIRRLKIYESRIGAIRAYAKDEGQLRMMFLSLIAKTNELFLGREVLDKAFTFEAHSYLFDCFTIKDNSRSLAQQYRRKSRLILLPRAAYKSTGDCVDTIAYIVNWPNIEIMILCANLQLAQSFVREIKDQFVVHDPDNLTPFQAIFSADVRLDLAKKDDGTYPTLSLLVHEKETGRANEFACPCRSIDAGTGITLYAGALSASRTGRHPHVLKGDDAINELSTANREVTEESNRKIFAAKKLIRPGGESQFLGTPYAPGDYYALLRRDPGKDLISVIKPARWLRKDINGATALDRGIAPRDLTRWDYCYLFLQNKNLEPQLTPEFLERAEAEDVRSYLSQYELSFEGYHKVVFPDTLIDSILISSDQVPFADIIATYVFWDLAGSSGSVTTDYTVGAVVQVGRDGVGYVTDLIRDRFRVSELVSTIADVNHTLRPLRHVIENSLGADRLEGEIRRAAADRGDEIAIEWAPVDNRKNAKAMRIERLEAKFKERRLLIVNSLPYLTEVREEFRDFPQSRYDDCADAISFSLRVLPDARSGPLNPVETARAEAILREKDAFERIFYSSPEQYLDATPTPPVPEQPVEIWDPYGIPQK